MHLINLLVKVGSCARKRGCAIKREGAVFTTFTVLWFVRPVLRCSFKSFHQLGRSETIGVLLSDRSTQQVVFKYYSPQCGMGQGNIFSLFVSPKEGRYPSLWSQVPFQPLFPCTLQGVPQSCHWSCQGGTLRTP